MINRISKNTVSGYFFLILLGGLSTGSVNVMGSAAAAHATTPKPSIVDAARIFNVLNYGAENDGRVDAQLAIKEAIGAAKEWTDASPSNSATVFFPAGTYNLSRLFYRFAINVDGAGNLKIEGEACSDNFARNYCVKLVGASPGLNSRVQLATYNSFFQITNSHNISIVNFYLDKERPYFTQGVVTSVNGGGGGGLTGRRRWSF
jgi:hypothetical protein